MNYQNVCAYFKTQPNTYFTIQSEHEKILIDDSVIIRPRSVQSFMFHCCCFFGPAATFQLSDTVTTLTSACYLSTLHLISGC